MSVIDVLGINDPELVMTMPLPLIMDLVKAKVRLEESKTKAQKAARDLAALTSKK